MLWIIGFFPFFFSDKKGGKGKDPRNDTSDEEDSPQSGKIVKLSSFFSYTLYLIRVENSILRSI